MGVTVADPTMYDLSDKSPFTGGPTAQDVGGKFIPTVSINAADEGIKADVLEGQRQMTPGQDGTSEDGGLAAQLSDVKADPKYAPSARERAKAAFLGAEDSMAGLRAAEGEMGLIAQGGKKFVRDGSVAETGLREISKEQYSQIMDGGDIKSIVGQNPVAQAESEPKSTPGIESAKKFTKNRLDSFGGATSPAFEQNPPVDNQSQGVEIIDEPGALQRASNKAFSQDFLKDRIGKVR